MLTIQKINTRSKAEVQRFVHFPFRLYEDHPQWVPPLLGDIRLMMNREKHPFYEHSDADFFVAVRDGRDVARITALENRRYNEFHGKRQVQFYLFDCEDDQEAVTALFHHVFEWARERGLDQIIGPKGFSALDGYGLLIEGFEHRQMMNMMSYNYPYYPRLVEAIGFQKEVDFVTCYLDATKFRLPERVHRISERIQRRGTLTVQRFKSKRELKAWAPRIGQMYNETFAENWEYHPLTEREIAFILDNLTLVAQPRLIKIITHKEQVVGFLFAFPDVSAAMQRAKGRLFPLGIVHLLREMRSTRWLAVNGAGILPEFQGRGGNALLYSEMEKTVRESDFEHAGLAQIAETAVQMRRDLENVGAQPTKNHRVYKRDL
jgi:GNAT superfamily N-acetyltransferase